jgi:hypothetical protein
MAHAVTLQPRMFDRRLALTLVASDRVMRFLQDRSLKSDDGAGHGEREARAA